MSKKLIRCAAVSGALLFSVTAGLSTANLVYAEKEYKSAHEYDTTVSETEQTYESSKDGENVILAKDGTANFLKAKITKSGDGDAKDIDLNAAVLSINSSKIKISDSEIKTNGKYANALLALGDATIETSETKVEASGENSSALVAMDGGTVIASGGEYRATGNNSPAVRLVGEVIVKDNAKIESAFSNSILIEGDGTLSINGSAISALRGDAIVVDGADAKVNIERTEMTYGSDTDAVKKGNNDEHNFLNAKKSKVVLESKKNPIFGNIVADEKTTLELNFSERTSFEGIINKENKAKNVKVKLDSKSRMVLTGDSYISELENETLDNSNIFANGHKLYVAGEEVSINQEVSETWDYDFSTDSTEPKDEEIFKDKTNLLTLLGAFSFAFMVALISTISIAKGHKRDKRAYYERKTVERASSNKMKRPWERK